MTYNLRLSAAADGDNSWPNRKEMLSGQIQYHEPDIFGVQEAMPDQIAYLDSSLSQYDHVGMAREGKDKGEASAIFYKSSRFKLIKTKTFWLSETPDSISKGWDAAWLRVCTYALFNDKKTNRQFWVFNTHLDNEGAVARKKGVELILNEIKKINRDGKALFFTGDFNSGPDDEPILEVSKTMDDSRKLSRQKPFGPEGTFNGFHFDKPVTARIDYIFVSRQPKILVKKYAVLTDSDKLRYPSDHLPVLAEVLIQ